MGDKSDMRYVIEARLLGLDDSTNKKRRSSVSWRHAHNLPLTVFNNCLTASLLYSLAIIRDESS